MNENTEIVLEVDPRFPSGPWVGFFTQPVLPGKHRMELKLTFSLGTLSGEGRDWVGEFLIKGKYSVEDGSCYWTKRYLKKHDVFYKGFNEGKGIWGAWEIRKSTGDLAMTGGFYIWPEAMPDPTEQHLNEQADIPIILEEEEEIEFLTPLMNEPLQTISE